MRGHIELHGHLSLVVLDLDGQIQDRWDGDNLMTTVGLEYQAALLATLFGTAVPTISSAAGTFGAIGGRSGNPPSTPTSVTPHVGDTKLAAEIARNYVMGYGNSGESFTLTFTFGFPPAPNTYKINEAGVFLGGTSTPTSGTLLDHAAISPTVNQAANEISVLTAVFNLS